ncbi:MAG: hypothetical protein K2H98_05030 [Duncaniella sp.]|nr:hypothetical protein [Duncaniella sp.]
MKKIFTLFAATLLSLGAWAQESVSVTWTLGAKVYENIDGVPSDQNSVTGILTKGSNMNGKGSRTAKPSSGDIKMTTWSQAIKGAYDADTYVEFTVTPKDGYSFKPTNISFDHGSVKNGMGRYDIEYRNGENVVSVAKTKTSTRINESTDDASLNYHCSYALKDTEATEDSHVVRIYFYSSSATDGSSREFGLANVIISGVAEALGETREAADINWAVEELAYKIRDNVPALPELQNPHNLAVTYSSTNAEVAEVNEAGEVVLKNTKEGIAFITADFDGDDNYRPGSSTLKVTVTTNRVVNKLVYFDGEKLSPEVDKIYKAELDSYPTGEIYKDRCLTIETRSETINGSVAGEYAGQKFTKSIQVKVNSEPSDEDPYGNEYGDSESEARKTTSLIVKPNVDLTLYVYGRRQTLENADKYEEIDDEENNVITCNHYYTFVANDGKSLKFDDTDEPTVVLEKNVYLGEWVGTDYVFGISEVELQAGQEYNMYAIGTTYQVNGIGYIEKEKNPNVVPSDDNIIAFVSGTNGGSMTDDNGFTVARTGAGKLSSGNNIMVYGKNYTSTKMKGIITDDEQITYTITAPEGKVISAVTVYAYASNHKTDDAIYFTKVGNHTFAEGETEAIASTDAKTPVINSFNHIMLNSVDMELHTGLNDDVCAVFEVTIYNAEHAPAAPVLTVDGEEATSDEYEFESETAVVINPSAAHHNIYFHFAAEEAQAAPAKVKLYAEGATAAPVTSMVHEGKTFTLMPEEGVTINKAGTLSFFAHDPVNDLTSEVKALKVKGNGVVTGIENVAVDAAGQVEYFNLQGIRVANPENGVFIRRQGNDVKKVVL